MTIELPALSLHQSAIAVAACTRAGRVPLVLGPPGVGKTSLMRAITPMVAAAIGYDPREYPAVTCVLSNREAVDVGGFPVVLSDDTVEQRLFGTLAEAATRPCLLGLDEFLTCNQSVQGPALRLVLERFAGEHPLHPGTRIMCAANPPDQAPGGIQLTAALVNRLVIINCRPLISEVAAYFCGRPEAELVTDLDLPDETTWLARRRQLMDTAGILFEGRPELVCFDPLPASISDGEPFGSPRAWEVCCDVLAALPVDRVNAVDDITRALVIGSVGPVSGIAYLSILRARGHLPTVTDVVKAPDTAKLPDESIEIETAEGRKRIGRDITFATIPLVIEAARVDTYATWVYVNRLPSEIQNAVAKQLMARHKSPHDTPWKAAGGQIALDITKRLTEPAVAAAPVRKAG